MAKILLALFSSISIFFLSTPSYGQSSILAKFPPHLVAGCRIFSSNGDLLQKFPGKYCLFLDDGRLISADSERMVMLKSDKSEVWKIPGHFHHQINWSEDKKHILALTSEFIDENGVATRADIIKIIDLEGKVVAENGARKIYQEKKIKADYRPYWWDPNTKSKATIEMSHFNSFYEIPKLLTKSKLGFIQPGNFIVNVLHIGAFVLSPDLKNTLGIINFPSSKNQLLHDVQVTKQGHVLFFNNERVRDLSKTGPRSSIEILDPASKKNVYTFMASPPEMFYSFLCGGIQELNSEYLLISHITDGFFFLHKKTKAVHYSNILSENREMKGTFTQQIKAEDLTEFLKWW